MTLGKDGDDDDDNDTWWSLRLSFVEAYSGGKEWLFGCIGAPDTSNRFLLLRLRLRVLIDVVVSVALETATRSSDRSANAMVED